MLRNPARERLTKGHLALGMALRQARTVDIAAAMASCGYDWLFIDLEHGSMPLDIAVQISVAALSAGIAPLVRVPSRQFSLATRALDGGALGIVMPHVDTPEEAREIVDHLKYPPQGHRSVAGGLPHFGYRPMTMGATTGTFNAEMLVVVMLETPRAVANAAAIAAVPGVDVLLVGTNDLAMEMGMPGELGRPEIADAYERVIAACRQHGKWPGMGGVYVEDLLAKYVALGMRMVLAGGDLAMMMAGASRRAEFLRAMS